MPSCMELPEYLSLHHYPSVLTIAEGGFISIIDGTPVLDYWALFTSPLTWSIVVLSIVAVLYISAVFLTWYANQAGETVSNKLNAEICIVLGFPANHYCIGIVYELSFHNPEHFERILDLWWMFGLSFLLWIGTVWLMWKRKNYGLAVGLLIGQFALAFYAYGISFYPYLLYPYLTIHEGFTNDAMAISLVVVFILGLILLIPSMYLLLKLFLFDKEYVKGTEIKKETRKGVS